MSGVPHFLIIGAMKSGTTTLYDDLATSPEFSLPEIKEPAILATSHDDEDARARYDRHFRDACGRLRGDGSTIYAQVPRHPSVAERARRICGAELRLVMLMRDPVDRILSHLRHHLATGRIETGEFDRRVAELPDYIDVSDYPRQLRPWVDAFGADRLLCVSFDALGTRRDATVREVATFLGGDPSLLDVGSSASNRSETLRTLRRGALSRFTQTDLYRYRLRRMLPPGLRERIKELAVHRAPFAQVALSTEMTARLRERFATIEDEVAALTGQRVAILRREGAADG